MNAIANWIDRMCLESNIQLSDVNSFIIESIFQIHTLQSLKGIEMTLNRMIVCVCVWGGASENVAYRKRPGKELLFDPSHIQFNWHCVYLIPIKRTLSFVIQRWSHPHFNYLIASSTQWMTLPNVQFECKNRNNEMKRNKNRQKI